MRKKTKKTQTEPRHILIPAHDQYLAEELSALLLGSSRRDYAAFDSAVALEGQVVEGRLSESMHKFLLGQLRRRRLAHAYERVERWSSPATGQTTEQKTGSAPVRVPHLKLAAVDGKTISTSRPRRRLKRFGSGR